ncbi:MAG: disulfide oxidoreductase, partial [Alphaproteobacteria bacterium]|nr:disulfide oxidoreductase [Alphaproteobacteria bacterium]
LSITGMTLEQFANLMEGLGYRATKGERPKARAQAAPEAPEEAKPDGDRAEEATEEAPAEAPAEAEEAAPAEPEVEAATDAPAETEAPAEPELEVFYTFAWAGNRPRREGGGQQGRPKGKPRQPKPKGKRPPREGAKSFQARPPKKDKIDPDNPFAAALMGLAKKD